MGTSRYVYNRALSGIKKGDDKYNFFALRNKYVTQKNNTICNDWEFDTPKDIRAEAINDLCKAFKSTISNKNNGNITHFEMQFKKRTSPQTIVIPKSAINIRNKKISIYSSFMNDIKSCNDKALNNINIKYDCRLTLQNGQYYLIIPIDIKKKDCKGKGEAGLDPGSRKMFTVYSDKCAYKASIKKDNIKKLRDKLSKLQSLRAHKLITKNKANRASMKIRVRSTNAINDLHYKLIDELVSNYNDIYLPKFKSQELVKINKIKNVRSDLLCLKHYRFSQRINDIAERTLGCNIHECTEEWTTKTCTRCGTWNNPGLSEVYTCNACNLIIDRDINGSRNILIKSTC